MLTSDEETKAQRSKGLEDTCLVLRVLFHYAFIRRHKGKALVLKHDYLKQIWCFIFIRSWLSSSTLKSIRYKIVNFDTKLLEGKVKEDPDQGESIKPVSFTHSCLYLGVLGHYCNTWVTVVQCQVVPWGPCLGSFKRPSAVFSCMGIEHSGSF